MKLKVEEWVTRWGGRYYLIYEKHFLWWQDTPKIYDTYEKACDAAVELLEKVKEERSKPKRAFFTLKGNRIVKSEV